MPSQTGGDEGRRPQKSALCAAVRAALRAEGCRLQTEHKLQNGCAA
eukprot:gene7966-4979_t